MPQLTNHKLDTVANALSLPDFNHHRASDDALTCGYLYLRFAKMLQERGLQVVVAEAGHVGGGQTGRTTAKLTAQHGAIYAGLIERLGRDNIRAILDDAERGADVCPDGMR